MTDTLERFDAPPPVLKPRRRWRDELRPSAVTGGVSALPLMVLFALNAADELDRVAFGVLLPEIRDYFGVNLTTVVTVSSVATAFVILAGIAIGYLADRLPRNRMLAVGAIAWGIFSILTGFAPTLIVLAVFRFGSGAAKSLDPAQQSILSDYYPPDTRAGVFSFHKLGNSVGDRKSVV